MSLHQIADRILSHAIAARGRARRVGHGLHPLPAEFFPSVPKAWRLAVQVNQQAVPSGRPAGGPMWAGLASSFSWIDPVHGVGGVFLSQIVPFADTGSVPACCDFETAVYAACAEPG